MKDFSSLIGIPYEEKDCWGIAVEWYRLVLGIELKHYYDEVPNDRTKANSLVYSSLGDFEKIETPKFGDIILIKLFGVECHIAIYLGEGKIFHTQRNVGSMVDRLSKWEKVITGYYRVKPNDKT